eukprot:6208978-Pleurochrysis_carterae.AAC.7
MEKFVHGNRNGEVVGGPANARRMRHATKEGSKPPFWTYLKVNGCRVSETGSGRDNKLCYKWKV